MASSVLLQIVLLSIFVHVAASMKCTLQDKKDRGITIDPSKDMCAYEPFQGPVGNIIVNMRPSNISKAAIKSGQNVLFYISEASKFVPLVGNFLKMCFRMYSRTVYGGPSTIIGKITKNLEDEINTVMRYLGQKIQQLEYTQLSQMLIGLLSAAKACSDYDQMSQIKDLESCLISLNTRVASAVGRFMPADDSIIAYDWSLPLFRQYADLQLTVTLDLVRVATALNKKASRKDYLRRITAQANSFHKFSNSSVERILYVHTQYASPNCQTSIKFAVPSNPFTAVLGAQTDCYQVLFRGRWCKENIFISEQKKNIGKAKKKTFYKALDCMKEYAADVASNVKKDLRAFWTVELLDVAEEWKKSAKKAEDVLQKLP